MSRNNTLNIWILKNPKKLSGITNYSCKQTCCNENILILRLIPHIKGNVGFVFTKEELTEIRDLILANKVAAPAKAGAIAPCDVFVPKGNTGLGPEKTSFFQALAIPTKIAKGTIEILVSVIFLFVIAWCLVSVTNYVNFYCLLFAYFNIS